MNMFKSPEKLKKKCERRTNHQTVHDLMAGTPYVVSVRIPPLRDLKRISFTLERIVGRQIVSNTYTHGIHHTAHEIERCHQS
jgi:hypothetical protein